MVACGRGLVCVVEEVAGVVVLYGLIGTEGYHLGTGVHLALWFLWHWVERSVEAVHAGFMCCPGKPVVEGLVFFVVL